MSVEEMNFVPSCAHVWVDLEVLEQSTRAALLDTDDDGTWQALRCDGKATVHRSRKSGCR